MFREILTDSQQAVLELLSRIAEARTFYPLLRPLRDSSWGLMMADPHDIAAMKLAALARRGSRKDFVDLYFYARGVGPLDQVLDQFREKYRGITVDPYHLLRSLTFFDDAESEAMPDLVVGIAWDEVETFFKGEATRLFRELWLVNSGRKSRLSQEAADGDEDLPDRVRG